ncbi:MAG: hypothetical protein J2P20_03555 [Pseudonocardia sp.]|nr:hypothetical protein [Pseudonocardia sp.]MBO0872651.1 hypothetical protein [Pseudonocardia sp.]
MTPVSRGRKPKKTKQAKPMGRLELPPLDAVEECDCPACRGVDPDVDELVDGFLASAADARCSDDPYDAELFGATVVSLSRLGPGPDDALLEIIQPVVEERATEDAVALLLAVGAVAPGEVGRAAASAGTRLATAGLQRPRWAGELTMPVTFDEGLRLAHPSSELSVLAGVFTRAQRSHAFLVIVDEEDRGAAQDIVTLDAENLPEALEMLEADARREGIELARESLGPAEFRREAGAALDARAAHERDLDFLDAAEEMRAEEPDIPPYPVLAAMLRARLNTLPEPVTVSPTG